MRESVFDHKLPILPVQNHSNSRRRSFLNTLTRFTSTPSTPSKPKPSINPPLSPPSGSSNNQTNDPLSHYLTSLANNENVQSQLAWKRFTRVRPDDLQSNRIERRSKHMKSNSALIENIPKITEEGNIEEASLPSIDQENDSKDFASILNQLDKALDNTNFDKSIDTHPVQSNNSNKSNDSNEIIKSASFNQSLTKSHELFQSEPNFQSMNLNSIDKTERKRKVTRKKHQKVRIEDFEMMRVLGKGCAGKVLLVRHKYNGGLFAMKAIHKRHVLAHQELLHTLTEQTVLKRMTRDVLNPFVVQLHYSFHVSYSKIKLLISF